MIELTLGILLVFIISLGLVESYVHRIVLAQLPIRIHVNGSRGKSSVTRLIAAGLRSGGLRTFAKTTGTSPRIINEKGQDQIIHRLRSASIGEQIRLLRYLARKKPDAIILECMAVNPQYQWILEQNIVKSTIGVITNVRPDHIDEMGFTLQDNAMSLSNTIPFNGCLVTSERDMGNVLAGVAEKRRTKFNKVDPESISEKYMTRFSYLEHRDNVALALKVCELNGVDKNTALEGMLNSQPDPGATIIWKLNCNGTNNYFVNLLAANDPSSTYNIFQQIQPSIGDSPLCIFLNTRHDRRYRTDQLLNLIFNTIKPRLVIVRSEKLSSNFYEYYREHPDIKTIHLQNNVKIDDMIAEFSNLEDYFIVGIGNMVGWGEKFIQDLKQYRDD